MKNAIGGFLVAAVISVPWVCMAYDMGRGAGYDRAMVMEGKAEYRLDPQTGKIELHRIEHTKGNLKRVEPAPGHCY